MTPGAWSVEHLNITNVGGKFYSLYLEMFLKFGGFNKYNLIRLLVVMVLL